jgi:predicted amidophosphoribosyltransferase
MEIPNGEPARGDSGTGTRALVILQEKEQGGWLCSGCHATVRLVGNPTHCPKCLRKVFRVISKERQKEPQAEKPQ